MSLKAPTIVIFDMDGTTVRHINPWLLHVLERLDDGAYVAAKLFRWIFKRNARGPIIPSDDQFLTRRKPRLLVHRALHKVRRKSVEQIVEPFPGIYDVLNFLKERGVPMALVSNGLGKGYGYDILEKFELSPYFKATLFREDITKSKPSPQPLLLALQAMGVEAGAQDVIWYIGDRRKDVLAALALREHVVALVEPVALALNASLAVLEKNVGSDHIIPSFHEILDRLKELFGDQNGDAARAVPRAKAAE